MANPTANFADVSMKKAKVTLKEDKALDATAKVADYNAANDMVWASPTPSPAPPSPTSRTTASSCRRPTRWPLQSRK